MEKIEKIGILTSGGDAPGMNAVIGAVVKAANYNGAEVIGIKYGYHGLLDVYKRQGQRRSVFNQQTYR